MIAILSCIFLSFTLIGTWFAYEYLPATLSSTSELVGINGPSITHPHYDRHDQHESRLPPRQLSIRVNEAQNPHVKPLQLVFRASTAMAVKFRFVYCTIIPRHKI